MTLHLDLLILAWVNILHALTILYFVDWTYLTQYR